MSSTMRNQECRTVMSIPDTVASRSVPGGIGRGGLGPPFALVAHASTLARVVGGVA